MNQIKTGDKIKALAVTILDDQNANEFLACQDGSTLIKIHFKDPPFETIPYRTLFYVQGRLNSDSGTDQMLNIEVNLEQGHRFVSFKPDTIKLYRGLSVFDILETLPNLSDGKPLPGRNEFDGLYLFQLQRHAHFVKLIRDELTCGDFGETIPRYIKGSAYQKIFADFKEKMVQSKVQSGHLWSGKGGGQTKNNCVRRKGLFNLETSGNDEKTKSASVSSRKHKVDKVQLLQIHDYPKFQVKLNSTKLTSYVTSHQLESQSSDDSDICVIRKKRRKKNPFLDDEAANDDECSDDDDGEDLDDDLDGFIDDSEETSSNDFGTHKKIEIQLNRENLLQYLSRQTSRDLEKIGLTFVYSHPTDLLD